MAVNHLKIRIEAEGRDAEEVLSRVGRSLETLEAKAETVSRKTTRSMERIQRSTMEAGEAFRVLRRGVLQLATLIGAGALVRDIIETSNAFTQYRMTLDTLEGSHEAAIRKWQELLQFAAETPFKINQVMQAYKTMKAYGLDPTIEAMKALGDASAVLGGDTFQRIAYALGQMHSAGKLMAQDMRQLTEAGINVKDALRDAFGTADLDRLNQRIEAGVIHIEQVYDAFLDYMKSHFGGQMERLNLTLKGQWEELISYWQELEDQIMNTGAGDTLTAILKIFNDWLGAIVKDKEAMASLGGVLTTVFSAGLKSVYALKGGFHLLEGAVYAFEAAFYGSMEWLERKISSFLWEAGKAAKFLHMDNTASSFFEHSVEMANEAERSLAGYTKAAKKAAEAMKAYEKDFQSFAKVDSVLAKTMKEVRQARTLLKSHGSEAGKEEEHLVKQIELEKKRTQKIKESYEAAKAFIDVHSQTDEVAMAIERLKQQYDELEEAIWSAFEAGVIGADEAWKAMDELSMAQENDTARIIKSHRRAAEETSEAWKNAYNQITNFLEDWLSGSRSLVKSFVDWLRHLVAQIAATNIVGAFAAGMGLPGAAAWAGQGVLAMTGGAGGSGSILENLTSLTGIYNMVSGGLSGMGNFLMYGVPEKLLDMGAVEPAWLLGNLSPDVMGGLTAGFGTFLLQGLLGGDWGRAAVSGASTGLGAWGGATIGAMTSIGGPIGAALGAIGGGLVGKVLGGLFGDGTERTYLTQGFSFGYSPELGLQFGEPVTMRKEHGTPDMMDAIFKTQDQLMQGFKQTFDTTIDMLEKITPGIKEEFRGWGRDQSNPFTLYWSAENDKELKHDTELNIRRFSIEFMQPLVDTFKKDFKGEIQGLDLHLFTDDFKKRLGDGIEDAFSQIDFTKVESLDDLNEQLDRLGKVAQGVKELENYVEQVQRLDRAYKLATGKLDKYHASLEDINSQYEAQMQALEAMGVDLEQMPEFFEAWDKSINDLKEKIFGFVLDVPEKFDEHWQRIIKSISELDIGGKMVELINRSLEDPSALSNVGQQWAQWLGDSMKSAILSESMDMLMGQISNAYIQPIMQSFIGQAFSADSIMGAFTQIDQAIPALSQAGQSLAEVFSFIQRTGNLEGFDWSGWKEKYGGVWDEINQKNQEAAKTMELAAETHKESAKAHLEAAGALKESAAAIEAGAERLQAPPPVNVTVVAAPEATLG